MNQVFVTDVKPVLTTADLEARYKCAITRARQYLREIKAYNGGGALGKGRVTVEEGERWERRNIKNN